MAAQRRPVLRSPPRRNVFQDAPELQRFVLPNVQSTGRRLGQGSYGVVEELKINGLVCAGKKIYEVLVNQANEGFDNVVRRYVEECQLLSDMRHPHVVQFMGLCFMDDSPLPVLVMEMLKTSLDELLEGTTNIPLALRLSMLTDVAKGLVYLHNHIPRAVIHRDLSAKNVLLNSSMVAKISDLGNSRIVFLQPGELAKTLSKGPGTLVYMPPEALYSPPGTDPSKSRYGVKMDIFSFGHLALFTITQVFPRDLLPPNYPDPQDASRLLGRSEVERRRDYIAQLHQQLGQDHPLVRLIKRCLGNDPAHRPSAEEVLQRLEQVEIEDPYQHLTKLEMIRLIEGKEEEVARKVEEIREKEVEIGQNREEIRVKSEDIRVRDEELRSLQKFQQLRTQFQLEISIKEELVASLQRDLAASRAQSVEEVKLEISIKEELVASLQRDLAAGRAESAEEVRSLKEEVRLLRQQLSAPHINPKEPRLHPGASLEWKQCADLPVGMYSAQAVLLGNRLYVGGGVSKGGIGVAVLFTCDIAVDTWSTILTPVELFALATYHSQLVLAGGWFSQPPCKATNNLWVLGTDGRTWDQPLPPMPTPRYGAVAVSTDRHLIVAGGSGLGDIYLDVVEVFDGQQWTQTDPLPKRCDYIQSTCHSDFCYMMGGDQQGQSVVYASLRSLVAPSPHSTDRQQSVWMTLPDVPFVQSSTTVFAEALVAVGGCSGFLALGRSNSSILMYSPLSRTWVKVGEMPRALEFTCSITLPTGEMVVIGGLSWSTGTTNLVYKVTLTPGV